MLTGSGLLCLRSNEIDLSAEELRRTYVMLTDPKAEFRTLNSVLEPISPPACSLRCWRVSRCK